MHQETEHQTVPVEAGNDDNRFRTTVYLTDNELTSLDELKAHFRRHDRRHVGRSELIREAIRHYRETILAL